MSYTPTEWACGDTITAEKLNKLENGLADCCGGGSEPLIFTVTSEEVPCPNDPSSTTTKNTYSHSWQEIYDALSNGRAVLYLEGDEGSVTQWRFFVASESEAEDAPYVAGAVSFGVDNSSWIPQVNAVEFSSATSKEHITYCAQE